MTPDYGLLKGIHVGAVAISLALFALRGAWMLYSPARLLQRWVRILPHVVDTGLLGSAVLLAWQQGAGAMRGWLAAKVVALLVYIALGTVALKRGRTRRVRIAALIAALAIFGYIVSVALTKSPLGFIARL
jgi:uncharacterized membrane protein SirB2